MSEVKPIYLYRRKGLTDFAECNIDRFTELSPHKLFETKVVYEASDYDAIETARDQYRDLSIKYGDKLSEVLKERDAALAELAALKGGREAVIEYVALDDGLGTVIGCLAQGFTPKAGDLLYTAPPAQASAWVAVALEALRAIEPFITGASSRNGGAERYSVHALAADMVRSAISSAP